MSGENAKISRPQGGDELVVAAGGKITVKAGGALVLETGASLAPAGGQAAHIADPTGGATTDAEARAAIVSILNALEGAGIVAAS